MKGFEDEEKDLWKEILGKVESKIPKATFETWIAPTIGKIETGNRFIIVAKTDFACQWIKERYNNLFIAVLKEITGKDFAIEVKSQSAIEDNIANELLHSSQSGIPRICLNLPLAKTGESHAIKRLRIENERIRRRI